MNIRLEPLKPDQLSQFRDLLGSSEFGGCFCAVWTSYGDEWEQRCGDKSQPNFFLTSQNVHEGRHAGYLVYEAGDLVGWTGSGPKTAFPLLEKKLGSRLSKFSDSIWSVGCIAVKAEHRGRNLSEDIVRAVIELAATSGAEVIEAYPVQPFDEPRIYRGTPKLYQRTGFQEVGAERDGDFAILLMQRHLREP